MHNILGLRYMYIEAPLYYYCCCCFVFYYNDIDGGESSKRNAPSRYYTRISLCWSGTCTRVHMRVYGTNLIASRVRFPYECGGGNGVVLLLSWTSRTARAQQSRIIHDNIAIIKHHGTGRYMCAGSFWCFFFF